MKLFVDIETNGLFTTQLDINSMDVHCVVFIDEIDDQYFFYPNEECLVRDFIKERPQAELIGHNILGVDSVVLYHKINRYMGGSVDLMAYKMTDTLMLSQLMFPDLFNYDQNNYYMKLPKKLWGSHSLEAWGKRLGYEKQEHTDFSTFTPEMLEYCITDTRLCKKLYEHLCNHERGLPPDNVIRLETDFKIYTMVQQLTGVPYNISKADEVLNLLEEDWRQLKSWGEQTLPAKEIPYKKAGRAPKKIPFNITSRDQIGAYLCTKYAWDPAVLTEKTGKPQINEEILSSLPYPEAEIFAKAFSIGKMKAFIKTGASSWSKNYNQITGRIHGSINTLGTNTGRCSHNSPNLAQVPSSRSYMGKELRALFYASKPGHVFVGTDASGLELRCLAHYLYPYDDGRYARVVLEGDVHSHNQKAAGLDSRDTAKTFIYALIYGAGNKKLGATINPKASESEQEALGKEARGRFLSSIVGYDELSNGVRAAVRERGHIFAIDRRKIYVDKEHTALNYLLQSCGAIIMKQATCLFYERAKHLIEPMLHVHDEFQVMCKEEDAETVGKMAVASIQDTADILKFRLPLEGQYKVGESWEKTH